MRCVLAFPYSPRSLRFAISSPCTRGCSGVRLFHRVIASVWSGWHKALFFVQPRTGLAWQHEGFRDHWRGLSGGGSRGRPSIPPELRRLIRCLWQASPTWGSSHIVGELQELGIDTAKSTVETYRPKLRGPTSPSWTTFLRRHMQDIVAIDFFTVRDGCGQRPAQASHRRLRRPVHQR